MFRSLELALASLISISALAVLTALPAAALSSSSSPPLVNGAEVLCSGECDELPPVPPTRSGDPFDFGLGLKAVTEGADLIVETEGNVFVYGPANASKSIILEGSAIEVLEATLNAPEITLWVPNGPTDLDTDLGPVAIDLRPGIIDLGSLPPLICACITVLDAPGTDGRLEPELVLPGDLVLRSRPGDEVVVPPGVGGEITLDGGLSGGGVLVLASPVAGQDAEIPGLAIAENGDVYVDVSMVTLRRFSVKAGKSIVLGGASSMPVPEPTAALLLGLGLAGLAARRNAAS